MLFIKNLTEEANSSFGICVKSEDDNCGVTLILPNDEEVEILTSTIPGLAGSIRHSIETVGKFTNTLYKSDEMISSCLADKPTEIAAYVKGEKIALVCDYNSDGYPTIPVKVNLVNENEAETEKPKRFPRDMIVLICPRKEGSNIFVRIDGRNLAGKPVIVSTEEYQIALVMMKYPIWSNLKFPVYMYIEQGGESYGGIQLSSRTENKVVKNQIVDVDIKIAKDYLDESARILKEKIEEQRAARRAENSDGGYSHQKYNRNNNGNYNGRNNDNRGRNNNGGYNRNNGNSSVKFPSKFRDNNNGGRNFRRNGQR